MPFVRKCGRTQNALFCFIEKIVTAAHHNVMLYVHFLSYLLLSSTDSVTNINILAVTFSVKFANNTTSLTIVIFCGKHLHFHNSSTKHRTLRNSIWLQSLEEKVLK